MPNLLNADPCVNKKSTKSIKDLPELYVETARYGYPVPINIVLKRIVDRQFQINTQREAGVK